MASPEGLSEYLKFYDAYPNVACGLDHIITQGAAMPRALSQHVRARMCSNLSSTYGATETGGITIGPAHVICRNAGRGRLRDAGRRGRDRRTTTTSRCRSAGKGACACAPRRWSAATTAIRRRDGIAFRHGWFYPGDIACLQPDGMLIILGRERALLNFGGDKVRAELLEGRADDARERRACRRVHACRRIRHREAVGGGGAALADRRGRAAPPLRAGAGRRLRARAFRGGRGAADDRRRQARPRRGWRRWLGKARPNPLDIARYFRSSAAVGGCLGAVDSYPPWQFCNSFCRANFNILA